MTVAAFSAVEVAALLRAATAHCSGAASPSAPARYLAAVADAITADHAGICVLSGITNRRVRRVFSTPGIDCRRLSTMATTHAAAGSAVVDDGHGIVLGCDGGQVALCAVRDRAGQPFSPRDVAALRILCTACDPADLVRASGSAAAVPPARMSQVLDRLLDGRSEGEIAVEMQISQHTVHGHVKSLYRRYGVCSRPELMSRCLSRPPWVPPGFAAVGESGLGRRRTVPAAT